MLVIILIINTGLLSVQTNEATTGTGIRIFGNDTNGLTGAVTFEDVNKQVTEISTVTYNLQASANAGDILGTLRFGITLIVGIFLYMLGNILVLLGGYHFVLMNIADSLSDSAAIKLLFYMVSGAIATMCMFGVFGFARELAHIVKR